jgi:hypothetical protein
MRIGRIFWFGEQSLWHCAGEKVAQTAAVNSPAPHQEWNQLITLASPNLRSWQSAVFATSTTDDFF